MLVSFVVRILLFGPITPLIVMILDIINIRFSNSIHYFPMNVMDAVMRKDFLELYVFDTESFTLPPKSKKCFGIVLLIGKRAERETVNSKVSCQILFGIVPFILKFTQSYVGILLPRGIIFSD